MANIETRKNRQGKISYRVKIRLKGHPTQSATFDRKTDAKQWIQETETAIKTGRYLIAPESQRKTLTDAIDRYIKYVMPGKPKIASEQTAQLKWWERQIGDNLLAKITPALIAEQRDKLANEQTVRGKLRSHGTVNRYLAALSHLFSTAEKEWGWLEINPIKKVTKLKEPRGRVRYLSNNEKARLLAACRNSQNQHLYLICILALSTGARKNEILSLQWKHIDLHRQLIILENTKNGERRQLPLMGQAYDLLKEYSTNKQQEDDWLFPGKKNKPVDIRSAWKTAIKLAQLNDYRFHDNRHSAASYLAMSGATLAELSEILGHKSLHMVKRYAHLSDAHTANVVAKMNERFLG
ncbi:MAG: site-specific integrase [Gammaproteobacteria bacterium]|nr:site-specific integrase [Gammaproteobacteria bacterium]